MESAFNTNSGTTAKSQHIFQRPSATGKLDYDKLGRTGNVKVLSGEIISVYNPVNEVDGSDTDLCENRNDTDYIDDNCKAGTKNSTVSVKAMNDEDEKMGPELPECVLQPFTRIYITDQYDTGIAKEKCEAYPRPANARTLQVPKLNTWLDEMITEEHEKQDQELQAVQRYMVASMTAVAGQAKTLVGLRRWAKISTNCDVSDKANIFAQSYDSLMDVSLLLTKAMCDTNRFRRKLIKQGMADSLMELLLDGNKATPEWLAGEDVDNDMENIQEQTAIKNEPNESNSQSSRHNSGQWKSAFHKKGAKKVEFSSISQADTITDDTEIQSENTKLLSSLKHSIKLEPHLINPKPLKPSTLSESQIMNTKVSSRASKGILNVTSNEKQKHGDEAFLQDHFREKDPDDSDSDGAGAFSQPSSPEDQIETEVDEDSSSGSGQPLSEEVQLGSHSSQKTGVKTPVRPVQNTALEIPIETKSECQDTYEDQPAKPVMGIQCGTATMGQSSGSVVSLKLSGKKKAICNDCSKGFSSLPNLKRHRMITHGKKPYGCNICGEAFLKVAALKKHMLSHSSENSHLCSHCGTSFSQARALVIHKRLHRGDNTFICSESECGKKFVNMHNLKTHIIRHGHTAGLDGYKWKRKHKNTCSDCGQEFNAKFILMMHMMMIHGPSEKVPTCLICNKKFVAKYELEQHMRLHTGERPFLCSECGMTFRRGTDRSKHMRRHTKPFICSECDARFPYQQNLVQHNNQVHHQLTSTKGMHCCPECGKTFGDAGCLTAHRKIHTGIRPHLCSECDKRFLTFGGLKRHTKTHNKNTKRRSRTDPTGKEHMCSQCGQGFIHSYSLKKHIMIHKGEKLHMCSVCGKKFMTAGNLNLHSITHTGEKPYACSVCSKKFAKKSSATAHAFSHTGEKPYPCSDCEKRFADSTNLKRHMKVHTEPKSFQCSECDKTFNYKANLKTHMRSHTGEKPHLCKTCGKRFSVASNLNTHLKTHDQAKCRICDKEFSNTERLRSHMECHMGEQAAK